MSSRRASRGPLEAGKDSSSWSARHQTWLVLGAIVVLSLALRVAISAFVPVDRLIDPDTSGYLAPAWSLVDHARFSVPGESDGFFRTPGYPVFLALLSQVVGRSVRSLAVAQAALSALTAVGIFLLASRWFAARRVALVAAALAAFEPLQIWASGQILTEALTAALYVVIALSATSAARSRSPIRWVLVGIAFAAATYVRPASYYLPLVLAPFVLVSLYRCRPTAETWRRSFACTAAFVLPFLLLVGLWQVRNHNEVGSWRFSGVEAYTLYRIQAPQVLAYENGRSFKTNRNTLNLSFFYRHPGERIGTASDHEYAEGLQILRDHPMGLVRSSGRGVVKAVAGVQPSPLNTLGLGASSQLLSLIARAGIFVFYGLSLAGVAHTFRNPSSRSLRPAHFLVLVLVVYIMATAGIVNGALTTAKYRAPVVPLLCPYAAMGAADLVRRARGRHVTEGQLQTAGANATPGE